jgi:hypothetical protein
MRANITGKRVTINLIHKRRENELLEQNSGGFKKEHS